MMPPPITEPCGAELPQEARRASLANVRVVLHQPQGAANVGSVARVIRNMGLGELAIVRDTPLRQPWLRAMAAHAGDVVDAMRTYATLAEAVSDCALVVGTTARTGGYRAITSPPRQAAQEIVARAQRQSVALVFGPEDHGLSNAELELCHQLIAIPTAPEYLSLNLAQAVMVCAYELFLASDETIPAVDLQLASSALLERMYGNLRSALLTIGFLHADNPDHIMLALRQLFGRTGLHLREARILLGLARQIHWYGTKGAAASQPGSPVPPRPSA